MANLVCPCGKPPFPLWQTLFSPVAKPFFPSIYWDISSDVDLERYVSLLRRFRAGCILRIISSKYDAAPLRTGWSLHWLPCCRRARFARNFILYPPSMISRLHHRLVAPLDSLLQRSSSPQFITPTSVAYPAIRQLYPVIHQF